MDAHEKVVESMGDTARQDPYGFHALGLAEPGLYGVLFLLRAPPGADIR